MISSPIIKEHWALLVLVLKYVYDYLSLIKFKHYWTVEVSIVMHIASKPYLPKKDNEHNFVFKRELY